MTKHMENKRKVISGEKFQDFLGKLEKLPRYIFWYSTKNSCPDASDKKSEIFCTKMKVIPFVKNLLLKISHLNLGFLFFPKI